MDTMYGLLKFLHIAGVIIAGVIIWLRGVFALAVHPQTTCRWSRATVVTAAGELPQVVDG